MDKQRNTYDYQVIRALQRKLYLLELRGGGCEKCGYNKNLSALEFHHKNPNEKEAQLDSRHLSNKSMKWILNEFSKCEVLCSICHREKHNPQLKLEIVKNKIEQFVGKNSIKTKLISTKPKCLDCQKNINYTYKRCTPCNNVYKRKCLRPTMEKLNQMKNEIGVKNMAIHFSVSQRTIRRWMY